MADITLNSSVRANLRVMQASSDLLARTEERLSTGKKVNSAFDNPASFFTGQALDRRAGDLGGLLDSVSNSVKTLEAADNGISAISDVVDGLKATARSALQSPGAVATKSSVESASINGLSETNLLGAASGAVAATVTGTTTGLSTGTTMGSFGIGGSWFDITVGSSHYQYGVNGATTVGDIIDYVNNTVPDVSASLNSSGAVELVADDTTTSFTLGSYMGVTSLGFAPTTYSPSGGPGPLSGKTLSFEDTQGATKTVTFSAGAGANNVDTLDELNAWLKSNDVRQQASITGSGASGKLKLETVNAAANDTPADLAGTATDAGGPFAADKTYSAPVLDPAAAERRANFVKDYNDALKQIASIAKDASFNGVNLLDGDDLEIVFNEDGSSKLDVKGANLSDTGLGLSSLLDADFYDADSVNGVLDQIEGAFAKLETQASKFGSQLQIVQTRETFTEEMMATLKNGASALVDADANEEAASLATLQTRQSLIVSSLSISTSSEQNILSLLR